MRLAMMFGAAVGGMMMLASGANAMPVGKAPAETGVELAAQGCGPGYARGRFGNCRPMMGRPYGRPGYGRPMFAPGPRCFVRATPYGPRRVCR